jgi:tetratricopeptide (TPR) repeat protein
MKADRFENGSGPIMLCCGICLISALMIVPVQKGIDARRGDPGPDSDLLYFSSPSVVKKMALGYENLLADVYWLRAIQYFGRIDRGKINAEPFKNLATFLDIITTLDPDLIDACRVGSVFLSEGEPVGAGQPEEAVKLLDKGIEAHPDLWRLRLDKGFVYYWYLKDFKAAGNVWLEASRRPESPEWMAGLAAMSLTKGGAIEVARALWQQQYNESTREDIKENARNCLISLEVAEDLWTLEFLLGVYRLENGMFPRSLEDLSSGESRKIIQADPLGTPYDYDPETGAVSLSPQSEVIYIEIPDSYKEDFQSTLVQ